jgi:hypothetical protein
MLTHHKDPANPNRHYFLKTGRERFKTDGLSSLQYNVKELYLSKLYTRIVVELATPT